MARLRKRPQASDTLVDNTRPKKYSRHGLARSRVSCFKLLTRLWTTSVKFGNVSLSFQTARLGCLPCSRQVRLVMTVSHYIFPGASGNVWEASGSLRERLRSLRELPRASGRLPGASGSLREPLVGLREPLRASGKPPEASGSVWKASGMTRECLGAYET